MDRTEWVLLGNLLDGFDRLYDGESGAVDGYALLEATGRALRTSDLVQEMVAIAQSVLGVVRSDRPEAARAAEALDVIQPLREQVATHWEEGWFEFGPRVRADFQDVDKLGRVRLNAATTNSDLEGLGVTLVSGLAIIVYEPNKIEATGTAEWSEDEKAWVVRLGPVRYLDGGA